MTEQGTALATGEASTDTSALATGDQQHTAGGDQATGGETALGTGQQEGGESTATTADGDQSGGQSEIAYDLKAPEGFEVDKTQLDAYTEVAKAQKLTQEQAQAVLDFQFKIAQQAGEQAKAQQAEAEQRVVQQQHEWIAELKKDPQFETMVKDANRLIARNADPETATMLRSSWMGSHPGLVRFLAKIGAMLRDDAFGGGTQGTGAGEKTEGERLFGSSS